MEDYRRRLAAAIARKRIDQKELAEKIDIPRQSVSRIINGRQILTFDTAVKACRHLGISLDWLAYGQEEENKPNNFIFFPDPERQRIEYMFSIMRKNNYPELIKAMEKILNEEMARRLSED